MDDLDLLKEDWKKQEKSLPHLSYNEIYKMIWKKSSSIVKWIFVISILEFLLGSDFKYLSWLMRNTGSKWKNIVLLNLQLSVYS